MFNATIEYEKISDLLDSIDVLVDECKLQTSENGLAIRAVDPANVGMADASLHASECKEFEASDGVLGIDLDKLTNSVEMGSQGDLIHLELDQETRKLTIKVGGLSYTLALIDPDSIREEPDIPELDLPAEVTIEGSQLNRGIQAADMVGDHTTLLFNDEAEEFEINAEGDTDDVDYTVKSDEMIDYTAGEAKSLFSIEYLKSINKAIPKTAEIVIELGESFPIKIHFATDSGVDVTYMLAPRIQSD